MKDILKLAWRNLWRNKRRTIITLSSVASALLFALIMRAMQLGSYDNMIKNVVEYYNGYIQIHKNGYWEDKSIENIFESNDSLKNKIKEYDNIKELVPRFESFALASAGDHTKGVAIIGVNPEKEDNMTNLSDKLVKGSYIEENKRGVLVAEDLAKYLKLKVNDTIVFIGQGYHGISAADKYPVNGIIHIASPDLNGRVIYMDLNTCREFYSAYGMLTSLVVRIDDKDEMYETIAHLKTILDTEKYEVMSWKEMLKELTQQIESDNAGGKIFLGILYLIIAFGVFGTIMMMTTERKREFSVMVAIGMQKTKLAFIVFIETIFIGIIGILTGSIISMPIIQYYVHNPIELEGEMAEAVINMGIEPIMPFAWEAGYFINQSIVVLIIMIIAIIYPLITILRLNVVKSIRQ